MVGRYRARAVRGPRTDGRWYWRAEWYDGGASGTAWTGWATRDEVAVAVARLLVEPPAPEPPKSDPDHAPVTTVRDLLRAYLRAERRRGQAGQIAWRTYEAERTNARRLARRIGDVVVAALTVETLERYRDAQLATSASATVDLDMTLFMRAHRWGRRARRIPDVEVPRPRVKVSPTRDTHTPERADVEAVLAQLAGWPRMAVLMYAATGARHSELATIDWPDVDLEQRTIHVDGKTGPRDVPIAPALVAEIREWRLSHPWVFWPVAPATFHTLTERHLPRACKAAGVRRFTLQAIRRAVVDLLYDTPAVDVGTAASLVGHSPQTALEHYRRSKPRDKRAAVEASGMGTWGMGVPDEPPDDLH